MKKSAVIFLALLFTPDNCMYSDNLFSQYVITPTATDLGKYADIPISYYTGQANISIPLYNTTQLGVPFQIDLSYDGSGHLINKLPGWTGHNWTLSAGGVITRVENGQADEWEVPNNYDPSLPYSRGFIHTYAALNDFLEYAASNHKSPIDYTNPGDNNEIVQNLWVGDMQPDVFFFNFCGISGRFFLGNDGQWKVLSDSNIKVLFDFENDYIFPFIENFPDGASFKQPKTIKGFTLIDDQGIRYTFGGTTDAIDYSMPLAGMGYQCSRSNFSWHATAWYLTQITDRLGNELYNFEYERGYYVTHASYNYYKTQEYGTTSGALGVNSGISFYNNPFSYYSFTISAPTYLKEIRIQDGTTIVFKTSKAFSTNRTAYPSLYQKYYRNDFYSSFFTDRYTDIMGIMDNSYRYYYLSDNGYDNKSSNYRYSSDVSHDPFNATGIKCLDTIIFKTNDIPTKKVSITYNAKAPRMHITRLSVTNWEGGDEQCYNLDYKDYDKLPNDYLSPDVDDWGYFSYRDSIMTQPAVYDTIWGNNAHTLIGKVEIREPAQYSYFYNHSKCGAGALVQIVYPTGGRAVFEYENNDHHFYLSTDRQNIITLPDDSTAWNGGQRIKSIKTYNTPNSTLYCSKREFFYELENGMSSGELAALPCHYYVWHPSNGSNSHLTVYTESISSIIPLQSSFGSHVGYSRVVEKIDGEESIYVYSNYSNTIKDFPYLYRHQEVTPYDKYGEVGYRRGKLLSMTIKDKAGKVTKRQLFNYRTDNVESNYVIASNVEQKHVESSTIPGFNYPSGGFYQLFYPKYDVISIEEIESRDTDVSCRTTFKKIDFNGDRFVRSIIKKWNYGKHLSDDLTADSIEYRYVFDSVIPSGDSLQVNDVIKSEWQQQCQWHEALVQNHYLQPWREDHFFNRSHISSSVMIYDQFNGNQILPKETYTYGDTVFDKTIYLGYNRLGLPTKLQKDGCSPTNLFWEGDKLLAMVESAAEPTFEGADGVFIGGIPISVCSQAEAKTVQYNTLNQITGITDVLGILKNYSYDKMGRLNEIRNHHEELISSHSYHILDNHANYVKTIFSLDSNHSKDYSDYQYYDGLGRPTLSATNSLNTSGNYVFSLREYDEKGRESKVWNPIVGSIQCENIVPQYSNLSSAFYGDTCGYSLTSFDVLDRPIQETTAGESWSQEQKSKTFHYGYCCNNEVKRYQINNNSLSYTYYQEGDLTKEEIIDEDEHKTQIFKDCRGLVILEKKDLESETLCTYYIYNNKAQLVFVLEPMYQNDPSLSKYAFQYTYDDCGRVKTKKIPGCSPTEYWYDSAGRIVKFQDGVLSESEKYRLYSYDALGRMTRQRIQTANNVEYDEVVNFYDNYAFLDTIYLSNPSVRALLLPEETQYGHAQLTGTIQRASNGQKLFTVYAYDDFGRICQQSEIGIDGRLTKSIFQYNFVGDVLSGKRQYYDLPANGSADLILEAQTINKYDSPHTKLPTSSLLVIKRPCLDTMREDTIIIMRPTYDEFGHVIANDRSGTAADMSYAYDMLHGWITQVGSAGGFEQHLCRESGASQQYYNGSISAMSWKDPQSGIWRRYDYHYDGLNRLDEAIYEEPSSASGLSSSSLANLITMIPSPAEQISCNKYGEQIAYNANSNIVSLQRYGMLNDRTYGLIDDLSIEYNGNQRSSATDYAQSQLLYTGASDFVDKQTEDVEYEYNANGALIKDLNRGITNIEYDLLGNPTTITMKNRRSIRYVYSADGRRLRTVHSTPLWPDVAPFPLEGGSHGVSNTMSSTVSTFGGFGPIGPIGPISPIDHVMGVDSTEYVDNFLFRNGHLHQYHFDGGYISFSADTIDGFHYYIQDYMGNNRMVVNGRTDSIEQVTHYYPYGGVIGDISTNESLQPYKFEGKELDRTFGLDNYDIEARQYFAMAPMWDRPDKLAHKYYGISPYVYCGGDPVNRGDYDGRKIEITAPKGKVEDYKAKFQKALHYLREIGASSIIDDIINDESYTIRINPTGYSDQTSGYERGVLYWNPDYAVVTDLGYVMSPAEALAHEADHAHDDKTNHEKHEKRLNTPDSEYKNKEERRVIEGSEQDTAKKTGKELPKEGVTRKNHTSIDKFKVSDPTSSTRLEQ